ncbi:dienelactone hydrolase family protein [Taibaiella lutea]|uniref:Dienelactone hydrolase family protein n=1 Tax=Taibaiella lutea TaxID=2608001 RepID=A0A5M6CBD0_9BACT|nr:dienelactone hydrolase family protein [Taibaiella lutea]KAA5532331.1 dienelactone hydrolase family protein [Taibaiella lutea]
MKSKIILLHLFLFMFLNVVHAQQQQVAYNDGKQKLNGELWKPAKMNDKRAGILILPAWKGIDAHSKIVAKQLSDLGYVAFIADIYGEGHYPKTDKEAGESAGYYKTHIDEYRQRIKLALIQLVRSGVNPDEIVVIGYCFGGLGAIEAARANMPVKGVVSFHGSYDHDAAKPETLIQPRILILHGADDPHSSAAVIAQLQDEFRKAHADWQMIYYSNAVHAFTDPDAGSDNSKGVAYNENADKRSWQAFMQFLQEVL